MDFDRLRSLFPVARDWVYLNNAAVAPVSTRVVEAIGRFMEEYALLGFTNPTPWVRRVEEIRGSAARLIGAAPEEIAFVRNTSHGLSLVARGLDWKPGDVVVVPEGEYPSNVYPWMALERHGVRLRRIPMRDGGFAIKDIESALEGARLVSVSSAEFLNGFRHDLDAIAAMAKRAGALICVDAIQTLGAFPLDVSQCPVDFLSADAHKWLLGPEGIGIFHVRSSHILGMDPALVGWNSVVDPLVFHRIDYTLKPDATRFEEGSLPGAMIMALGAALDLILECGVERIAQRILDLTARVGDAGRARGWEFFTPMNNPAHRSGIVSFKVPGRDTPALIESLMARKIFASNRAGWIRVSPHAYNNEEDIARLIAALDDA